MNDKEASLLLLVDDVFTFIKVTSFVNIDKNCLIYHCFLIVFLVDGFRENCMIDLASVEIFWFRS